ncbi:12322_t:CDS:2 [Ambispora gerdemannii]|uniref:12322_t:CDS:1 n=1 Tax=Ambispora gerdemannii TaxID=144530 RepID=A0A9N9A7Z2_9GLOM|nr:12322_t:CDS:2 [Ambispora gerdemannii]
MNTIPGISEKYYWEWPIEEIESQVNGQNGTAKMLDDVDSFNEIYK